jgi:hypothetical protein
VISVENGRIGTFSIKFYKILLLACRLTIATFLIFLITFSFIFCLGYFPVLWTFLIAFTGVDCVFFIWICIISFSTDGGSGIGG